VCREDHTPAFAEADVGCAITSARTAGRIPSVALAPAAHDDFIAILKE
jgi:hypothetical protein